MLVHVTHIPVNLGIDTPLQMVSGPVFASLRHAETWVYETCLAELLAHPEWLSDAFDLEFVTNDFGTRVLELSSPSLGTEVLLVATVHSVGVIPEPKAAARIAVKVPVAAPEPAPVFVHATPEPHTCAFRGCGKP